MVGNHNIPSNDYWANYCIIKYVINKKCVVVPCTFCFIEYFRMRDFKRKVNYYQEALIDVTEELEEYIDEIESGENNTEQRERLVESLFSRHYLTKCVTETSGFRLLGFPDLLNKPLGFVFFINAALFFFLLRADLSARPARASALRSMCLLMEAHALYV